MFVKQAKFSALNGFSDILFRFVFFQFNHITAILKALTQLPQIWLFRREFKSKRSDKAILSLFTTNSWSRKLQLYIHHFLQLVELKKSSLKLLTIGKNRAIVFACFQNLSQNIAKKGYWNMAFPPMPFNCHLLIQTINHGTYGFLVCIWRSVLRITRLLIHIIPHLICGCIMQKKSTLLLGATGVGFAMIPIKIFMQTNGLTLMKFSQSRYPGCATAINRRVNT